MLSWVTDLHPRGVSLTLAGLSCLELPYCSAREEVSTSSVEVGPGFTELGDRTQMVFTAGKILTCKTVWCFSMLDFLEISRRNENGGTKIENSRTDPDSLFSYPSDAAFGTFSHSLGAHLCRLSREANPKRRWGRTGGFASEVCSVSKTLLQEILFALLSYLGGHRTVAAASPEPIAIC